MNTSTLRRVSLAMVAVVAVGCSSNATADPTTTTIDRSPVTSPSTTTTTVPETTTTTELATTTTAAETTAAPTEATAPPTTLFQTPPTIYPADDPRAEVETAYRTIENAWLTCVGALPTCDSATLAEWFGGRALEVDQEFVTKLGGAGYSVKGLDGFRYVIRNVTIDGNTAKVERCIFDPVTISRPDPAGGADQIYAEGISSDISIADLERGSDGKWRVLSATKIESVKGTSLCDA